MSGKGIIPLLMWIQHLRALLDWRIPDYILRMEREADPNKLNPEFGKALRHQLGKAIENTLIETPIIFIFGEWGAGKTHQLLAFRNKTKEDIEYRSFWGINSVLEGVLHTIPFIQRLYVLLIIAFGGCAFYVTSPEAFSTLETWKWLLGGASAIVSTIVLIPSRWKTIYVFLAALAVPLGRKRIVILDDLERSSLTSSELWKLLLNLWKLNVQYIVPIGNDSSGKELEWRNLVAKLNGQIINLHASKDAKVEWVMSNWPAAPFLNHGEWTQQFTLRDLTVMAEEYYDLTHDREGFICNLIALSIVLAKSFEKAQISQNDRRVFSFNHIHLTENGRISIEVEADSFVKPKLRLVKLRLSHILSNLDTDFKKDLATQLRNHAGLQAAILNETPEGISLIQLPN